MRGVSGVNVHVRTAVETPPPSTSEAPQPSTDEEPSPPSVGQVITVVVPPLPDPRSPELIQAAAGYGVDTQDLISPDPAVRAVITRYVDAVINADAARNAARQQATEAPPASITSMPVLGAGLGATLLGAAPALFLLRSGSPARAAAWAVSSLVLGAGTAALQFRRAAIRHATQQNQLAVAEQRFANALQDARSAFPQQPYTAG